ncbi:uncharacterized protein LOC106154170 [Lingula anatina]|uniref:Uncharacterized protein LOC106154170 n=1 Tax=Lingula anatina TaxID=7574 RepID=A0A1S3HD27_LINAN|nr:uncharacterized protein LOC106154170 [Lingula anatina]|eukprot:XP_013383895.1 uncharacterized protein LOC106154170 [Lingula anatina]
MKHRFLGSCKNKWFHERESFPFLEYRISSDFVTKIEEVTENDSVVTSVALKGLPVSQGVVRGTARVVTSLQEASQIQPGDILIVPYTDVGWSPYFPLISGLVTELGGLLSHGAVVAREYGLPCVVNIPKATHLFAIGKETDALCHSFCHCELTL